LKKSLFSVDSNHVEENLMKHLASGSKTWSDTYKIIRHDKTVATVASRASIVRNKEGKAIRLIGATQDISLLQELEQKLMEQDEIKRENAEIFQLAARLSYDGIWDWNILTNEYFLGEGFEKLFGFAATNDNNVPFNWADYIHPDDKDEVENGIAEALISTLSRWEHAYRFVRKDGTVAHVFGRASIIRDGEGKATRMIGVIHDLSRQQELEEEIASTRKSLQESNESFRLMFNSSSDILFDIDLIKDEIVLSDGYSKAFGYPVTPHMKPNEVWSMHLHPDDMHLIFEEYNRILSSDETSWKLNYRFAKVDGTFANISSSGIIMRNAVGKACRLIGSMQDVSKESVLEERLAKEIALKEKQIQDAMAEAKETERSDLGKELHDNVNQLLGVSRLYLEMAKQGGEKSELHMNRSSQFTLTAIEEIRKLTKGLTTDIKYLGLVESILNLASDTMQVKPVIILCNLDRFAGETLNEKFKLNVFRIVQEQLNNILKHSQAGKVTITLSQNEESVFLSISDNGVGFDTTQKRKGIGLDNIQSRAAAFNGIANFESSPGKGCVLTVNFIIIDALLKKE
jgi:PAS domain S-box-containing protein